MIGPRQVDQAALFYEFSLERHVPATHQLRSIDRFVDLSDVRSHVAPFYSSTGRPSDRSRTTHPDAARRLLLRHSFRTAVLLAGASFGSGNRVSLSASVATSRASDHQRESGR